MPRGVLLGEPETLGLVPYERRPGEACLVMTRHPETGGAVAAAMRWGLPTTTDPRRRILQIHVEQLRGRRQARRARCLVPVDGYAQLGVRRTRFRVKVTVGMSLAIAAVWTDGPGGPRFAIVTTEANELLAPIHGRMPVLLPAGMWSRWIADAPLTPTDLAILEKPAPPAWLSARAIRAEPPPDSQRSVRQQLAEWAPGCTLWEPRRQEEPSPLSPKPAELPLAPGGGPG